MAAGVVVMICVAAVPSHVCDAVSDAYAQNDSLESYTFTIRGVMAMRTFPWLHFHFVGQGSYVRGVRYVVHLTQLPFFAKAFTRVDLSALAPSMWPHRYNVMLAGKEGDDDIYRLQDREDRNLRDAIVRVDPASGIKELQLIYKNGSSVTLFLDCERSTGYLLPNTATGQIAAPLGKLGVAATFGDYDLLAHGNVQTTTDGR